MIDKGKILEAQLHYLLWNMGYFVRRNIRLMLEKGVEITDIDVYGIKFEELLRPTKIAIECKHQESNFGNILKLRGISDYYNIDFPILVREKISLSALDFLKSLNMMGFTHNHLEDIEKNIGKPFEKSDPIGPYSIENGSYIENSVKILNSNNDMKKLIWDLHETWMIRDPYKRYMHLRDSCNIVIKITSDDFDEKFETSLNWLIFEIIILAALSCIEIATTLFDVPTYHKKNILTTNLLGGDISRKEKKNVVQIVREIIEVTGIDIDKKMFKLEPEFIPELHELLKELMKYPVLCQTYLRFLDYEVSAYIIKEKEIDLDKLKNIFNISTHKIDMFSKWNMLLIKSLDEERKIPKNLTPLM